MNKKLRLLIAENCNRKCDWCCNNNFNIEDLPICKDFSQYELIMLTGGEPMLDVDNVISVINSIKSQNPQAKIVVYTAFYDIIAFKGVLPLIDGLTITLHNQKDLIKFLALNQYFDINKITDKSLRLNIFSKVKIAKPTYDRLMKKWNIKSNIEWIKDCPLPDGEDFMRI